jgi:hypothetical protein
LVGECHENCLSAIADRCRALPLFQITAYGFVARTMQTPRLCHETGSSTHLLSRLPIHRLRVSSLRGKAAGLSISSTGLTPRNEFPGSKSLVSKD